MSVSEMLKKFLISKSAQGVTLATLSWYRSNIKAFDKWLQTHLDTELGPDVMEFYFVYLRNRQRIWDSKASRKGARVLADESIVSANRALRVFFKYCQKRNYITQSPMEGVKIQKAEPKEPRAALHSEVVQLIASMPADEWIGLRDRLIVSTAFYAALRVGEIVQLEPQHFDLKQQVLHVPGGKTGGGMVPLLDELIDAYRAYLPYHPTGANSKRLFISSNGFDVPRGELSESGVRHMLKRRCQAASLRHLNPHSFRHGAAMYLLNERRADMSLVQASLRHSNISITNRHYARWTLKNLGDEYRRVMGNQ